MPETACLEGAAVAEMSEKPSPRAEPFEPFGCASVRLKWREAIRRGQEQARPEREALEALGSCYMKALAAQLGGAESRFTEVRQQRRSLREKQEAL